MSAVWISVVVVGLATIAIKAAGPLLLARRTPPPRAQAALEHLAPALLAALAATTAASPSTPASPAWPRGPSPSSCAPPCWWSSPPPPSPPPWSAWSPDRLAGRVGPLAASVT